jgi:hypothetical protein
MSRDKRGNRTQEVDGSSPFSSTNFHQSPTGNLGSQVKKRVSSLASSSSETLHEFSIIYARFFARFQEVIGSIVGVSSMKKELFFILRS